MKTKIFALFLVSFFYCLSVSAQSRSPKVDPVGQWKFEAPYAPEGYTTGVIEIGFTEKKYSASMNFSQLDYKVIGEKVKFENDSLSFLIYVEGQDVMVGLKMETGTEMSGKAVYYEGEIPLTLVKSVDAEKK